VSSPTEAQRPPLAWVALGLLAALVVTNAIFLALLQTGGPLIGLVLYAVLLWRWKQRDYQATMVGGFVGLAVHVVEVVTVGWSVHPALMTLNLLLPALLAPIAWRADQRA
jgi:heme O synthase-like polyprenyltransferase